METRPYGALRDIIEGRGGTMTYERAGSTHGAWVIKLGGRGERVIPAGGNSSYPDLDRLYVPKIEHPMHWDDYSDDLVPDAEERLLAII